MASTACIGAAVVAACDVVPGREAIGVFTRDAGFIEPPLTEEARDGGVAADYYTLSADALRETLDSRIRDAGGSTECREVTDVRSTRVWTCTYSDVDGAAGVYEISMIVPAEDVPRLDDLEARRQLAAECCSRVVMTFLSE